MRNRLEGHNPANPTSLYSLSGDALLQNPLLEPYLVSICFLNTDQNTLDVFFAFYGQLQTVADKLAVLHYPVTDHSNIFLTLIECKHPCVLTILNELSAVSESDKAAVEKLMGHAANNGVNALISAILTSPEQEENPTIKEQQTQVVARLLTLLESMSSDVVIKILSAKLNIEHHSERFTQWCDYNTLQLCFFRLKGFSVNLDIILKILDLLHTVFPEDQKITLLSHMAKNKQSSAHNVFFSIVSSYNDNSAAITTVINKLFELLPHNVFFEQTSMLCCDQPDKDGQYHNISSFALTCANGNKTSLAWLEKMKTCLSDESVTEQTKSIVEGLLSERPCIFAEKSERNSKLLISCFYIEVITRLAGNGFFVTVTECFARNNSTHLTMIIEIAELISEEFYFCTLKRVLFNWICYPGDVTQKTTTWQNFLPYLTPDFLATLTHVEKYEALNRAMLNDLPSALLEKIYGDIQYGDNTQDVFFRSTLPIVLLSEESEISLLAVAYVFAHKLKRPDYLYLLFKHLPENQVIAFFDKEHFTYPYLDLDLLRHAYSKGAENRFVNDIQCFSFTAEQSALILSKLSCFINWEEIKYGEKCNYNDDARKRLVEYFINTLHAAVSRESSSTATQGEKLFTILSADLKLSSAFIKQLAKGQTPASLGQSLFRRTGQRNEDMKYEVLQAIIKSKMSDNEKLAVYCRMMTDVNSSLYQFFIVQRGKTAVIPVNTTINAFCSNPFSSGSKLHKAYKEFLSLFKSSYPGATNERAIKSLIYTEKNAKKTQLFALSAQQQRRPSALNAAYKLFSAEQEGDSPEQPTLHNAKPAPIDLYEAEKSAFRAYRKSNSSGNGVGSFEMTILK